MRAAPGARPPAAISCFWRNRIAAFGIKVRSPKGSDSWKRRCACRAGRRLMRCRRRSPRCMRAPNYEDTDWKQIAGLYEVLLRISPSPVIELNHAAAISMVDGPARALDL